MSPPSHLFGVVLVGAFIGRAVFRLFAETRRLGDWIKDRTVGAFDRWLTRTCFPDLPPR